MGTGIFLIAWNGYFYAGRKDVYGTKAPTFNVDREKGEGFPSREEASRELEILSARSPHREYRIEEA